MTIRDDARQEAERRWPTRAYGGTSMNGMRREYFVAGAVWASEQHYHVERVARVLAQTSALTQRDARLLVETAQKIADAEQPDREPSESVGELASGLHSGRSNEGELAEPSEDEVEAGRDILDRTGGWRILRKYGGMSAGWMDTVRDGIVRNILRAVQEVRRGD